MNYKLDNPVALKVINCMMLDKSVPVKTVVAYAKCFGYDLNQTLDYCLRHKFMRYTTAVYIHKMYRTTFKSIIKNRNHELSMRNVTR